MYIRISSTISFPLTLSPFTFFLLSSADFLFLSMTTTVIEVALALPFVLAAGVLGTVALTPPKAALQQPPDAEQAPERQTLLEKTAYRNVVVTNFMEKVHCVTARSSLLAH